LVTEILLKDSVETFTNDIVTLPDTKAFNAKNHIDYTLVEANTKLMQLNHKAEKFSFLPSVNLFFNHQQQNMNNEFDAFSGGKYYPSTVLGASVRLPILTSGSRLAKMSQAKIEWDKALNQQKEAEQGLIYQSELAHSNVETAIETNNNNKANMLLAKKIYDKTIQKYKEGIVGSTELSLAQNQYLTAEGNYIKSLLDLFKAKSELQKSYGGQ
jgi:outer membrane protein TolC